MTIGKMRAAVARAVDAQRLTMEDARLIAAAAEKTIEPEERALAVDAVAHFTRNADAFAIDKAALEVLNGLGTGTVPANPLFFESHQSQLPPAGTSLSLQDLSHLLRDSGRPDLRPEVVALALKMNQVSVANERKLGSFTSAEWMAVKGRLAKTFVGYGQMDGGATTADQPAIERYKKELATQPTTVAPMAFFADAIGYPRGNLLPTVAERGQAPHEWSAEESRGWMRNLKSGPPDTVTMAARAQLEALVQKNKDEPFRVRYLPGGQIFTFPPPTNIELGEYLPGMETAGTLDQVTGPVASAPQGVWKALLDVESPLSQRLSFLSGLLSAAEEHGGITVTSAAGETLKVEASALRSMMDDYLERGLSGETPFGTRTATASPTTLAPAEDRRRSIGYAQTTNGHVWLNLDVFMMPGEVVGVAGTRDKAPLTTETLGRAQALVGTFPAGTPFRSTDLTTNVNALPDLASDPFHSNRDNARPALESYHPMASYDVLGHSKSLTGRTIDPEQGPLAWGTASLADPKDQGYALSDATILAMKIGPGFYSRENLITWLGQQGFFNGATPADAIGAARVVARATELGVLTWPPTQIQFIVDKLPKTPEGNAAAKRLLWASGDPGLLQSNAFDGRPLADHTRPVTPDPQVSRALINKLPRWARPDTELGTDQFTWANNSNWEWQRLGKSGLVGTLSDAAVADTAGRVPFSALDAMGGPTYNIAPPMDHLRFISRGLELAAFGDKTKWVEASARVFLTVGVPLELSQPRFFPDLIRLAIAAKVDLRDVNVYDGAGKVVALPDHPGFPR